MGGLVQFTPLHVVFLSFSIITYIADFTLGKLFKFYPTSKLVIFGQFRRFHFGRDLLRGRQLMVLFHHDLFGAFSNNYCPNFLDAMASNGQRCQQGHLDHSFCSLRSLAQVKTALLCSL